MAADGKAKFEFEGGASSFKSSVKEVIKGLKEADKTGKKTTTTFAELEEEIEGTAKTAKKTSKALDGLEKEVEGTGKAAKKTGKAFDGLEDDLADTDKAAKKTGRTFAEMKKEFADTQALQHIGDELGDVNDELLETAPAATSATDGLKGMLSTLGPLAAAATVGAAAVFGLVGSASELTDGIALASGQTGLIVETMTAMRFAAQEGGGSADGMTESLTALAGRLKEARKGSTEALAAFEKYEIELDNINGTARTTDAILRDVLDAMAGQATQSAKTEAAVSLLNESAGKVPVIFSDGAASLDEWTQKAEVQAIAAAVTEGKLNAYNASMAELTLATDAAKVMLGEQLLPAVVAVTTGVTEVIGPVASLLGTFWEMGEALNTVNPLYWLLTGALKGVVGAAELAHSATVKLGLSLSEEEKAAESAAAAWAEFDEQLINSFETQEQADEKAMARREERRKAFKEASEAEIKLNEKRAAIARKLEADQARAAAEQARLVAEQARIEAEAAKGREQFAAASAAGVAARIEDLRALAAVEDESFHDRLEALAAVRDNLKEELAVRAAAIDEIKSLNEVKAASDMAAADDAFEHWKAVQAKLHDERAAIAETEAATAAEADEARRAAISENAALAIETTQAVTTAILDGIMQAKTAESDAEVAKVEGRIATLKSKESLTEKEVKILERLEKKQKALTLKQFQREKKSNIAQILLSTAAAMMVAATGAPPPANVPLIASMATLGAAQAVEAAVVKPPLHDGGSVRADIGGAPDEFDRRLKENEFVLTSAVARGNEDMLNEANRTGSMAGAQSRAPSANAVADFLEDWFMGEVTGEGRIGTFFGRALPSTAGSFR